MFDKKTGSNILQWPVTEMEDLRSEVVEFNSVKLGPGSIAPLEVDTASQVCNLLGLLTKRVGKFSFEIIMFK